MLKYNVYVNLNCDTCKALNLNIYAVTTYLKGNSLVNLLTCCFEYRMFICDMYGHSESQKQPLRKSSNAGMPVSQKQFSTEINLRFMLSTFLSKSCIDGENVSS